MVNVQQLALGLEEEKTGAAALQKVWVSKCQRGLGTDEETQIHPLLLHAVSHGQWRPGKEQAQGHGGVLNPPAVASSKPYMVQRNT